MSLGNDLQSSSEMTSVGMKSSNPGPVQTCCYFKMTRELALNDNESKRSMPGTPHSQSPYHLNPCSSGINSPDFVRTSVTSIQNPLCFTLLDSQSCKHTHTHVCVRACTAPISLIFQLSAFQLRTVPQGCNRFIRVIQTRYAKNWLRHLGQKMLLL